MSDNTPSPDEIAGLHALPNDALLTVKEAAQILRLKVETLNFYRCNRPGFGPRFVRVGGRIRYSMGALREYIARQEMPAGLRRRATAALAARRREQAHG